MRTLGDRVTVFSDAVRLNYPSKLFRVLLGWPRLFKFSITTAFKSLLAKPDVDAVIVNSHFDLLAYALTGKLLFRGIPNLVLPGFIYTDSGSTAFSRMKYRYYKWILGYARVVVCHSHLEVEQNRNRFSLRNTQFVYYPCSVYVPEANGYSESTVTKTVALSAGRSGRDYDLLIEAVRGTDIRLKIINDQLSDELTKRITGNIEVLDQCYGDCYLRELQDCRFVIIPLSVDDISAGQMVLLQAMALGKPVIITRTKTTEDYIEQDSGVLEVEAGNKVEMQEAIEQLNTSDALCEKLGKQGAAAYAKNYSIEAYALNMLSAARQTF
jgi:glycosyltransferase involved in cell wall biosynthesis